MLIIYLPSWAGKVNEGKGFLPLLFTAGFPALITVSDTKWALYKWLLNECAHEWMSEKMYEWMHIIGQKKKKLPNI